MIESWQKFYEEYSTKIFNRLGWFGAALILLGYYLNANKDDQCWPVWMIGNLLMGLHCLNRRAYPAAIMSFILTAINVYGYLSWLEN